MFIHSHIFHPLWNCIPLYVSCILMPLLQLLAWITRVIGVPRRSLGRLNAELTPHTEGIWITSPQKAWHRGSGFTTLACGKEKLLLMFLSPPVPLLLLYFFFFFLFYSFFFWERKREREREMRLELLHRDFSFKIYEEMTACYLPGYFAQNQMWAFLGQGGVLMQWGKTRRKDDTSLLSEECHCPWKTVNQAVQSTWECSIWVLVWFLCFHFNKYDI